MRRLHIRRAAFPFAVALLLAGCTRPAKPAPDNSSTLPSVPEPAGSLVTAKAAYTPMFKYALAWSDDIVTLNLSARTVPGFQNTAGRAAQWVATFASPRKQESRIFSYSIAAVPPDIYKGIEALPPDPWPGPSPNAPPIDPTLFTIDSDAAYQTAAATTAAWLAQHPTQPLIALDLATTPDTHIPVWSIAWGDKKTHTLTQINATTGALYKSK
jgi:hypothetical protein